MEKKQITNKKWKGLTIGLSALAGLGLAGSIAGPLIALNKNKGGETVTFKDIRIECIEYGQIGYTFQKTDITVYGVYEIGGAEYETKIAATGEDAYKISINGVSQPNFGNSGYLWPEIDKYTVSVEYNGKTKQTSVSVLALACEVKTIIESDQISITGLKGAYKPLTTDISATYTLTNSGKKINPSTSYVKCGETTLTTDDGVNFLNGEILIPAKLVTDDITICLQTIDVSIQDQVLEQTVEEIAAACNKYESGQITKDEFISSFSVKVDGVSTKLTSENELISSQIKFEINGKEHVARVIDVNHDDIWDGTKVTGKAALTFDMVTLLSGSDGNAMTSMWDSANNYDYTNSILRWNLNDNGSGTKPSSGVWENSAFSMLPTSLQSSIKTVQKSVATTSSYTITTYSDKLFPLTMTEMAGSDSYAKVEGSAYKHWTEHSAQSSYTERMKKDVNNNAKQYFLCSPSTQYDSWVWTVTENAVFGGGYKVNATYCVSFAFCI